MGSQSDFSADSGPRVWGSRRLAAMVGMLFLDGVLDYSPARRQAPASSGTSRASISTRLGMEKASRKWLA